jgi:hypothetical protein
MINKIELYFDCVFETDASIYMLVQGEDVVSDEVLGVHLDSRLVELGITGGECHACTLDEHAVIKVVFFMSINLEPDVKSLLTSDVVGQLRDGIGENGIPFSNHGIAFRAFIQNDIPLRIDHHVVTESPYLTPHVAMAAFSRDMIKVEKAVREHPQTVNVPYDGLYALNFLVENSIAVEMLLSVGADPNMVDAFGYTSLHTVVLSESISESEKVRLCELLLRHGANPSILDFSGKRPYDLAAELGFKALEKVLQD